MVTNKLFRFVAVLLSIFLISACTGDDANKAPNVSFTTLEGQQISMADLKGKVVLVKFWATDCTTCVAQMPANIQRYQKYHKQGFETIAVAMKHDPENYVRNFTKSRNLPFVVAMDKDGNLAKEFGNVKMTPTAFLIDKKGNILKRYLGNYDEKDFENILNKALAA